MIFKIVLIVTGDDFFPNTILEKIKGHFQIASKNNPSDKKFENREDIYGFGSISFFHPKLFSTNETIIEYNEWLINFLRINHKIFINGGADGFQFFIEVYYDGEQCNFEIFNQNQLQEIFGIKISLPVSVYKLSTNELEKWEEEVRLDWQVSNN